MKISYNWLNKYIDSSINVDEMAKLLTDSGLEIESVESTSVKGGLEGLVVGEVLSKEKHPDADRLNLTTVNVGNGNPLHIVCGATNVEQGQKVIVATVGTKLYPTDGEAFEIKKSKIRGEVSEGMICAEDEIGLGKSHEGIMILDANATPGTPAKDYFNLKEDNILEIGLTPNRADATGHIGVARDLVAVLGKTQKINLIKPSVDDFKVDHTGLSIKVEVDNYDLCPRYSGVTIDNITIKESPDWLKERLTSIGLSPINNVVDATNFVLHETGQPLHAFDANKIKGGIIKVKTLANKTKFKTLDEVERELSDSDLMICNADEGMCIAGVFGGLDSGVSDSTTSIFLESAYFNPVSIRKSAKRHGLNTDASFRFERGADPNITIYALKRAANIICEISGGKVSSEIVDLYPNPINNFVVEFSYENCQRLIGQEIDKETIKKILTDLEIEITSETENGLTLSVPPFKVDVEREVDVIEEVLRIYGYNNIAVPNVLKSSLSFHTKPDKEKIVNTLSDLLVANGFNEMISNSLTKSSYYPNTQNELVQIQNPLSNELAVLRQSMLYNGLETILYNQNRKTSDLKLFEWGKTYIKKGIKFEETNYLSLFVSGKKEDENWNTDGRLINIYDLKGIVNIVVERLGLDKIKTTIKESELDNLAFGLQYEIGGKKLIELGKLTDSIQKQFDIDNDVFYAELNVDVLMSLMNTENVSYKEVSKFPVVRRDLALLIDKNVAYNQIKELAIQQDNGLLTAINLFDVYEGKNLEAGKKSYGVSFKFLDETKTLTDTEIDNEMKKIISSLENKLGAQLR